MINWLPDKPMLILRIILTWKCFLRSLSITGWDLARSILIHFACIGIAPPPLFMAQANCLPAAWTVKGEQFQCRQNGSNLIYDLTWLLSAVFYCAVYSTILQKLRTAVLLHRIWITLPIVLARAMNMSMFTTDNKMMFVEYADGECWLGGIVGRHGGRIAKGKFTLDGVDYQVPLTAGPNFCHGALFHKVR